jgi:hypothetical protein
MINTKFDVFSIYIWASSSKEIVKITVHDTASNNSLNLSSAPVSYQRSYLPDRPFQPLFYRQFGTGLLKNYLIPESVSEKQTNIFTHNVTLSVILKLLPPGQPNPSIKCYPLSIKENLYFCILIYMFISLLSFPFFRRIRLRVASAPAQHYFTAELSFYNSYSYTSTGNPTITIFPLLCNNFLVSQSPGNCCVSVFLFSRFGRGQNVNNLQLTFPQSSSIITPI